MKKQDSQPRLREAERPPVNTVIKQIMSSSGVLIFLAVLLALLVGALLVALFDPEVQKTAGYLFARPSDFFAALGSTFAGFFGSLFRGAIFDYSATDFTSMVRPITNTLTFGTPLILAGLSVAVAFRAGLFNIGAQGQLMLGAILGSWIGINLHLPYGLHLLAAVFGAIIGGALWGSIPGILKAKAGANEVIITIMLNSIALYLLAFLLKKEALIGANGYPGKSLHVQDTAAYPKLLGQSFDLHLGFVLAIAISFLVWWILERSTFGFELRAAGANPNAARTAGISVPKVIVWTMVLAGALAGLAGTAPTLGTEKFLSNGVAGTMGFDAITVALLGRSSPLGVVLAGILFGALNSGASTMQAAAGIPVDIVTVCQAVIVLLIAAPPLIRWIFRLPQPQDRRIAKSLDGEKESADTTNDDSALEDSPANTTPLVSSESGASSAGNGQEKEGQR